MKVAKIVEYSIRTRIIVDTADSEDSIIRKANNKLLNDPSGYIVGDNVGEIQDDIECPFDPKFDK